MNRTARLSPARQAAIDEAIVGANANLNNAALPLYGELLEALRTAEAALADAPQTAPTRLAARKIRRVLAAQTAA